MIFNVRLTHDLDLGFSRSRSENDVSQEWDGWLTWNEMLDLCCDFQRSPRPWPWPWIFKVKVWKCCISGMGWLIDLERKGCESIECWTHGVTFNVHLNHHLDLGFSRSNFSIAIDRNVRAHRHRTKVIWVDRVSYLLCGLQVWHWPWIFKVKFWKCCISGMGGPVDIERKGCESIGYYTYIVTSNWHQPWSWPWIFMVKYWNCCISGMGGSTHLEWKGCELDIMLDAQWYWPWAVVDGKWIGQVMGCRTSCFQTATIVLELLI